ncbi:MAG: hypothetical protein AB7O26_02515 [Planctomycetaceae bacterium]
MRLNTLSGCLATASLLVFAAGCDAGKKGDFKEVPKGTKVVETAHHHHEHGPHGGHIIELGDEEYHAEVAPNAEKKVIDIYLLGPDGKKPQTTDAKEASLNLTIAGKPHQLKATAAPLKGEPEGQSSHFEAAVKDEIRTDVSNVEALRGQLVVTIGGKQYTGKLDDHDHDHDHDHEHEAKEKK